MSWVCGRWRASPIGQRLVVGGRSLEIVGTVGPTMPVRLNRPSEPTIYVPYSDESYRRYAGARGILVRAAPGQAARVRPAVDDVLAGLGARAGIGPGLLAARLLSTQLRIDAGRDIWAIAIASTCLVAAAAMATVVPAMRQAATDPARLLRDSGTAD